MSGLIVTSIGGMCPTQAYGTMNGSPFYFRARHGVWTLDVTPPGVDPVAPRQGEALLSMDGDDPTHGWMDESDVMSILQQAFKALTEREAKP